jgi:NADH-quinone oxidoreductase subunit E
LLTPHTREHIDHWVAKFPPDRKRSAVIQGIVRGAGAERRMAHRRADRRRGEVSRPAAGVGVRGGQFLFDVRDPPVGRNNVAICTNILLAQRRRGHRAPLREEAGRASWASSTADGRIYLKREEECLAACCGAPVMVVNGHYHEKLDTGRWTHSG